MPFPARLNIDCKIPQFHVVAVPKEVKTKQIIHWEKIIILFLFSRSTKRTQHFAAAAARNNHGKGTVSTFEARKL